MVRCCDCAVAAAAAFAPPMTARRGRGAWMRSDRGFHFMQSLFCCVAYKRVALFRVLQLPPPRKPSEICEKRNEYRCRPRTADRNR